MEAMKRSVAARSWGEGEMKRWSREDLKVKDTVKDDSLNLNNCI